MTMMGVVVCLVIETIAYPRSQYRYTRTSNADFQDNQTLCTWRTHATQSYNTYSPTSKPQP